ncbi:hypothetical protein, unlikely [Trypanosoma brucei brucei TREU927]|uniref:Uncharacterized protein n=1 Tax=Trypanosoma brucei brucei (strain 927/4 GUTat10.1) TaxID=185431 RepID=Q4GYS8_TRYB2|nr:hypothetical protein, unlikely [Trypanosoma brucei brucei TREU927]CAJ16487.1 hypothetical protein, unlikely [Trypanosoma brucei brucei TREU927]
MPLSGKRVSAHFTVTLYPGILSRRLKPANGCCFISNLGEPEGKLQYVLWCRHVCR